ncbi:MAG TPA: HD-GYP domain-containing protein [Tissierellia bacterium]|nr:HD-GYP domain-containing protein [Tissierellia bacterium]
MMEEKNNIKTLKLYTYISTIAIIALLLMVKLINEYTVNDYVLLIVFSALSAIAETFLIPLPKVGAVSVSFALTFSAILLTNPLTAAIITAAGVIFRFPYADGRGRVHLFNTPLYKTIFNISQYIISAGVAGITYSFINKAINFGFVFLNPIAGALCLIVFLLLNSFFMATLMSILLNENLAFIWKNYLLGFVSTSLVGLLGIVVAYSYHSFGTGGILLFFIPLMLARYTFKLYLDMRKNYFETLNVLVRAIEANDTYTSGHSLRVSAYAEAIARQLSLPQNKIDLIKSAALLHDIGKIGIDKNILNKTGKLEKEEFEAIKTHPEIGASIISDLSYMSNISDIIRHHHERNDGRGYPDGLTYKDIPLETSILTIADSFDAMTTDRPYRYSLSLEDALQEIRDNAGTQFNPDIVDDAVIALKKAFFSMMK